MNESIFYVKMRKDIDPQLWYTPKKINFVRNDGKLCLIETTDSKSIFLVVEDSKDVPLTDSKSAMDILMAADYIEEDAVFPKEKLTLDNLKYLESITPGTSIQICSDTSMLITSEERRKYLISVFVPIWQSSRVFDVVKDMLRNDEKLAKYVEKILTIGSDNIECDKICYIDDSLPDTLPSADDPLRLATFGRDSQTDTCVITRYEYLDDKCILKRCGDVHVRTHDNAWITLPNSLGNLFYLGDDGKIHLSSIVTGQPTTCTVPSTWSTAASQFISGKIRQEFVALSVSRLASILASINQ